MAGDVRVVDRRDGWHWRPVGPRTTRYDPASDADARYILDAANRRARRPSVRDRDSGEIVVTIRPTRRGFKVDDVLLASPWLVWTEIEPEGRDRQTVIGHVLNLRTGRDRVVNDAPEALEPGLPPTWAAREGRAVYPTQQRATNCLAVLDLRELDSRVAHCTKRKRQSIGFPWLSYAGLGFNEWLPEAGRHGCTKVSVLSGPSLVQGRVRRVPARSKCGAFASAVGPNFVAWDEQKPGYQEEASIYAKAEGQPVLELGEGALATLIACRGWLYWEYNGPHNSELRRWRPKGPAQIVYRTPGGIDNSGMTGPSCQGDRITFVNGQVAPYNNQMYEGVIPSGS